MEYTYSYNIYQTKLYIKYIFCNKGQEIKFYSNPYIEYIHNYKVYKIKPYIEYTHTYKEYKIKLYIE